jgi:hypothetical protein
VLSLKSFSASGLVTSAFVQAYPGTAPILVDERDARVLECALDDLEVARRGALVPASS